MKLKKTKLSMLVMGYVLSLGLASSVSAEIINDNQNKTVNSVWNDAQSESITVGSQTHGSLTVQNGGEVHSELINIGLDGATGIVDIIDGGRIILSNSGNPDYVLTVGGDGSDSGGGSMSGMGILNISGFGSELYSDAEGENAVGSNGVEGRLTISDGGSMMLMAPSGGSNGLLIGSRGDMTGKGSVIVDSGGSLYSWARIVVGAYNEGSAMVSNGGSMSTDDELIIGLDASTLNTNNILTVTGQDSKASSRETIIGSQGAGALVLSDGGKLSAMEIFVAKEAGSKGELAVGSLAGEDATAAGEIDSMYIRFGYGEGSLTLNHSDSNFVLSSNLDGRGQVNAFNGTTRLEGHNSGFSGELAIYEPATIIITDSNQLGMDTTIINNGALNIISNYDWGFNNEMSGSGVLNVNTNGNRFDFSSSWLMSGFNGSVVLEHTQFELSGENTYSLRDVDLIMGEGSYVKVGMDTQEIGGLVFDGGTIEFGTITPGKEWTTSTVRTTGTLDISGEGTVQVDISGQVNNDRPSIPGVVSLLEQDDGNVLIQLASSEQGQSGVVGNGGMLQLVDTNGQMVSDRATHEISQNGQVVANGSYDYRLTSGHNEDGLYVNYGLTEVELLGTGNDALVLDAAGAWGAAADLSAKITGNGDLAIDTGDGQILSLSNGLNDYTGETLVYSGELEMRNDSVLGQTSKLYLMNNSSLNMNGHMQGVGELVTDAQSELKFNGGTLNVLTGGQVHGELSGNGALIVSGGELSIYGDNQSLSASTTIQQPAKVIIDDALGLGFGNAEVSGELEILNADGVLYNNLGSNGQVTLTDSQIELAGSNEYFSGEFVIDMNSQLTASDGRLGSAEVSNEGELVIQAWSDWLLDNVVQGSGLLTKQGAGVVTLTDAATYTGSTDIQQGGIILGSESSSMTLASDQVTVHEHAFLAGFGGVSGAIDNAGTLYVGSHTGGTGSAQTFTVGQDLINSGTIYVGEKTIDESARAGNLLHVLGNYSGNDGRIHFNTALNGDGSLTDKMIVDGDTDGTTYVSVDNAGGSGDQTIRGIELIQVNGRSDGEFVQSGRIVAGAYDYTLARGEGALDSNWYLTSYQDNPGTPGGVVPEESERSEVGAYIANIVGANTMFVTRLHDRLGETQYTEALTGEKKVTSFWLRQSGGISEWRNDSGQLKTKSYRYVVQFGGDIAQWSSDGLDRWHLGAMAGYAKGHGRTRSRVTNYTAKSDVNGYSTGLYATWYQNDEDKNGLYVDGWAQYSWFNNDVDGEKLARESYKSKGFTASLESGYTYKLNGGDAETSWYVRPHAQAVWMDVKADDHVERNGTRVSSSGDGNLMTRLGFRAYANSVYAPDSQIQPFAEINWIHNTKDFGATMNGVTINQDGARNLGEVKVGVEGQINSRLNVWSNVAAQFGDKDYYDASASIGVKYHF